MEIRDLRWLRTEVAFKVNFSQDDPNEDFGGVTGDAWKRIDHGINYAYRREWRKAVNEVGGTRFWEAEPVVWPAAATTLTLPSWLSDVSTQFIDDETDGAPGIRVYVNPRWGPASLYGVAPKLSWRSCDTLQWATSGPGRETTLLFTYYAEPKKLEVEGEEPVLIPYAHRDILTISAAVHLRFLSEDSAPQDWKDELKDLRRDFWAYIAKNRPRDPIANRIRGR